MKFRILSLAVIVLMATFLVTSVQPAHATVSGVGYSLTCSHLTVSGNSSNPTYPGHSVWLVLYRPSTGELLIDTYVSVSGGHFSWSGGYGGASPSDELWVDVWDGDSHPLRSITHCRNSSFEGPPLPAGFVLKTMTCTVAAAQSPGGDVVPGIKPLIPGATWFMSPTPVKDANGKLWTEVFVGSWNDVYIPAECAQ
jgi:hypothetical protein